MKLSPEVSQVLVRFGWSPSRNVDIGALMPTLLQHRSFHLTPRALPQNYLDLMSSVYGLTIDLFDSKIYKTELIIFDPEECGGHWPSVSQQVGKQVWPVAQVDNIACLYVASDDEYWCEYYALCFLGQSFDEAMRSLLWGRSSDKAAQLLK